MPLLEACTSTRVQAMKWTGGSGSSEGAMVSLSSQAFGAIGLRLVMVPSWQNHSTLQLTSRLVQRSWDYYQCDTMAVLHLAGYQWIHFTPMSICCLPIKQARPRWKRGATTRQGSREQQQSDFWLATNQLARKEERLLQGDRLTITMMDHAYSHARLS